MKVLVVGGTGLSGAHAALKLRQAGHEVSIMSRSKPVPPHPVADFKHIVANYRDGNTTKEQLQGFDWMLFAAGADIRQLPEGVDQAEFFHQANTVAIPAFFELAKAAGIKRTVYIGTYYPQIVPAAINTSAYVGSRHLADETIRALSDNSFNVCSLNAPFIIGHLDGLEVPHLEALVHYAAGHIEGLPLMAPAGGVNHINITSLSEAILAAFDHGESGKAYLVGDENLSWKTYLEMWCDAVGNPQDLPVTEEEHPIFPDIMLYAGRNAVVSYEPDTSVINYSRNQVKPAIEQIVAAAVAQ